MTDRRRPIAAGAALVAVAVVVGIALIVVLGTPPTAALPSSSPSARPSPTQSASPSPSPSPTPPATPTSLLEPADLSGVLVDPELAHRLPIAVSIDDNRIARPQSGFNGTSIVYQAPADGFESRYLLVYQEGDSPDIGPVRSARFYFAQWASELRAALAHYGGDRRTRVWIAAHTGTDLTSVDGIGAGNAAYHRIRERKAPHNAYTSTADVRRVALRLGGTDTIDSTIHVRPFRDDSPPTVRGTAQEVSIPYRTVTVGYRYDPVENGYLRLLDGKPHLDPADGEQVTARTIVVLFVAFRIDTKIEPGHARPDITSIGTGASIVFMEGRAIEATWSKGSDTAPTLILGPDGEELPLVRGRIFIQVVPIGTKVTS